MNRLITRTRPRPYQKPDGTPFRGPWAKLSDLDVAHLKAMAAEGMRARELAHEFCASRASVYQIVAGTSYSNVLPARTAFDATPAYLSEVAS